MKSIFLYTTIVSVLLLSSCENDGVTEFDCSDSDLQVSVSSTQNATCTDGGLVTLEASGGVGEIVFTIGGDSVTTQNSFSGLSSGSYIATARDTEGCERMVSFEIGSDANAIAISTTRQPTNCGENTGSIEVEASGGVGNYEYQLGSSDFGTTNVFDGLAQGDYAVRVRDEEGCQSSTTVKVLTNTSLENEIMPIIEANCALTTCHGSIQSPRFNSAQDVIDNAARIKSKTQDKTMPPSTQDPLSQSDIDKIACWVDDGAMDN